MNISLKYKYLHNPDGCCLLFMHGFMGNMQDWDTLVEDLKSNYSILLIDLPAHGQSINLSDNYYTFNSISTEIINIVKHLNINIINIIAYSMGGRVLLDIIFNSKLNINKIIFESVSFGIEDPLERIKRVNSDKSICDDIIKSDFINFINSWYSKTLWGNLNTSPNYHKLLQSRLSNNKAELVKSLNNTGLAKQESYLNRVSELGNLLYISGGLDIKYTILGRELIKTNKNIKHVVLNNTGHNTHFEQTNKFIKIIKQYLN